MLWYKKVCILLLFHIVTSSFASLSKITSLEDKEEYYQKIINDFPKSAITFSCFIYPYSVINNINRKGNKL